MGKGGSTICQIEELMGIMVGMANTDEGEVVVTAFWASVAGNDCAASPSVFGEGA